VATVAGGIVGGCSEIEIDRCIDDSELAAVCGDGNGGGDVASVSSADTDLFGDDEASNLSEDDGEGNSDTQAEDLERLVGNTMKADNCEGKEVIVGDL
jgi:hypothetical protein